MAIEHALAQEQSRALISRRLAEHWKLLLGIGIAFDILGILAISLPLLSTLAIDIFIGWLFLIGGILRVATLLRVRHWPGYWWSLTSGLLAIVVGALLLLTPWRGILTLTMLLSVLFLVDGITKIVASLDFRHHARTWSWVLFSGIADLLLVFLIWYGWPGTAAWAIGILAGVNLFLIGFSQVMLAFAMRPAA